MAFPPNRDHKITLEAARALTRRYRSKAGPEAVKGGMFPRDVFETLLAQPGCAAIRFYYGEAENGAPELVLVGVDVDGNDMTSASLFDLSLPCPPYCGDPDDGP